MKILNLFAGIGGNRVLWNEKNEITAVELNEDIANIYSKRFPKDTVIVADAYEYLELNFTKFHFIWASPPCQTHTKVMFSKKRLPDLRLYSIIIFLRRFFNGRFIVENVIPHYKPLIIPTSIVDRHYIWSNFIIEKKVFRKRTGNLKDYPIKTLCEIHNLDLSILNGLPKKLDQNHDCRGTILRNCVKPEVGKYIFDCMNKTKIQKKLIEIKND